MFYLLLQLLKIPGTEKKWRRWVKTLLDVSKQSSYCFINTLILWSACLYFFVWFKAGLFKVLVFSPCLRQSQSMNFCTSSAALHWRRAPRKSIFSLLRRLLCVTSSLPHCCQLCSASQIAEAAVTGLAVAEMWRLCPACSAVIEVTGRWGSCSCFTSAQIVSLSPLCPSLSII